MSDAPRQYSLLSRLILVVTIAGTLIAAMVVATGFMFRPEQEPVSLIPVSEADEEPVKAKISAQFKQISKLLTHPEDLATESISKVAADTLFQCERLRPTDAQRVFKDGQISIWRSPVEVDDEDGEIAYRGLDGCLSAFQELVQPFASLESQRVKFKIFRVETTESTIVTRQYFSLFGKNEEQGREINSVWKCQWTRPATETPPLLERIELERFEEAIIDAPNGTLFSDCTEAVLGANESYEKHLLYGCDYWSERSFFTPINGYQGIAIGDVNGDGLDDFYLCQESALPNRLFVQNPDGTATDRSAELGVDWLEGSRSALFVDLDNDGDQDLVVATFNALVFMENDGTGKFESRNNLRAARYGFSLSAADYDSDGLTDIYVGFYYPSTGDPDLIALPRVYHDANTGGRNILLHNEGNWEFTDVTEIAGLSKNNNRFSFATSWEDFDNDGDLDLYVANDYGRNNFYRNDYTVFTDIAADAGVEDQSFGMSVDWGDYNQDGWMDLYVANMFSAAGNRATFQSEFRSDNEEARQRFQYIARGNSLFMNNGSQTFSDVSPDTGVMMGRWSWGSRFVDLNNDSWEDLVVANGYLTRESSHDL